MKTIKFRAMKTLLAFALSLTLVVGLLPNTAEAKAKAKTDYTSYVKQVFDAAYYYETYSDVAAALGNDETKLLNHYITFGIKEGRNASATFNATTYRDNYGDLDSAFGDEMGLYFRHYVEFGIKEGRNAIDASAAPSSKTSTKAQAGTVIATYSTSYNARIARATNVILAASQINGLVIPVGETFSFLGSITPRTLENGYVVAPVFSGGKVSKGIGGGICQVSSTLYAAVLGTTCTVVERHAHSLPVTYIPSGMDATVSAPSLDFRFTNTYDKPLVITASADNGTLTVTLSLQ